VVSGLIAAVPGFIDYLYVIPPNSSAKQRAVQHMVVNVTALVLVAVGWAFRDWTSLKPQAIAIALEIGGVVFVTFGGWLGGTLVYRNQIGVDHRYANAGKWREQYIDGRPGEAVIIDGANELKPGQMMLLRVGSKDHRLVLARTSDGYAAFDDHCTHKGGTLAGGILTGCTVTCPWHGSQFSVKDGSVKSGPAEKPIATYRIEESTGAVRLVIPSK
jgi:nitrite reductase/ring-hydroxylating ferredoxin subunit